MNYYDDKPEKTFSPFLGVTITALGASFLSSHSITQFILNVVIYGFIGFFGMVLIESFNN